MWLDQGEAEAIALAAETPRALLLLDERRARLAARKLRLSMTGTLGILLEAKRRALIPSVRSCMDGLMYRTGFRISEALYQRVLYEAGERE